MGSNTKARFETTKMLRSSAGGLTLCYALRRLSNNIQEPYRTLSLQALDASIHWWKGKPAPRASALKAPWSLSPDLQKSLKQFLRQWHLQVLAHQVPCHVPSFKTIFVNMLRFGISSATTNRPSRCGLPISTSSAAARIGLSTRKHPSIRVTLTGYYQDLWPSPPRTCRHCGGLF